MFILLFMNIIYRSYTLCTYFAYIKKNVCMYIRRKEKNNFNFLEEKKRKLKKNIKNCAKKTVMVIHAYIVR